MNVDITLHVTAVGDSDTFTRTFINLNDGLIVDVICYLGEGDGNFVHVNMILNDKMVNRKKLLYGEVAVTFPFAD